MNWFRAVCMLWGLWLWGCTPGDGQNVLSLGSGQFGEPCQKTEDCASGLCVGVDEHGGICSRTCQSDLNCPGADNWACLTSNDPRLQLCACRKLASGEICGNGIDDDCDGKSDDCRMCGGVAVPEDDPQNCGRCGNSCSSSQLCKGGECVCPASTPDACGTRCTDLKVDSSNCGACGMGCGEGRSCKAGACECTDRDRSDFCPGLGCVSLQNDSNHCGGCSTACSLGQACESGKCACPSTTATDFCPGVGCINQQTDAVNCGGCGKTCTAGFVCSAGKCACPDGQSLCGEQCVDTQKNAANCGGCEMACGTAQACSGGTCGCTVFGYKACGTECADTSTDPKHCGSCDKACAQGELCAAGVCTCKSGLHCGGDACTATGDASNCGVCGNACSATQVCNSNLCACQGFGLSACGADCKDLSSDVANCGVCGRACPAGQGCVKGNCQCGVGQSYCAGTCVSLETDAANCGMCNKTCSATQVCSTGSCTCPLAGQQFCVAQNKCLDTTSDPQNCGACGHSCNPTEQCVSGTCKCPVDGQKYCASAGTCVDTLSNTANCGACDKKCDTTQVCSLGSCACPASGQTFCANANACVSLYDDETNCGACGKVCPAATHCSGACFCDNSGLSLCGSTCTNLQTDAGHCGSCTNACGGNFICASGSCKCPDPTPGVALRLTNDTTDQYQPVAAFDGVHVGVVYRRNDFNSIDNVRFMLLNVDGSVVSDVALTNYDTYPYRVIDGPVVTWTGTEYGVAWTAPYSTDQSTDVLFRRVGKDGNPLAPEVDATPHVPGTEHIGLGISWSNTYGGYAISYNRNSFNDPTRLAFRRLGATGASPENENAFNAAYQFSTQMLPLVAAPGGGWAIASDDNSHSVDLSLIDADGGHTLPTQHLFVSQSFGYIAGGPGLVHDGAQYLTTYIAPASSSTSARTVWVNRGTALNNPVRLLPLSTTISNLSSSISMVKGTLAVGFTESGTASSLHYKLKMQRYAIPTTPSSAVTPIHGIVEILSTQNIKDGALRDMQLVPTGNGSMLAVWADNRWGTPRELYARPIDLHGCP